MRLKALRFMVNVAVLIAVTLVDYLPARFADLARSVKMAKNPDKCPLLAKGGKKVIRAWPLNPMPAVRKPAHERDKKR